MNEPRRQVGAPWGEQWQDADDADGAFPSDWREQCDIAEASAVEDEPAWTHDVKRERATIRLWLGIYERAEIPPSHTLRITAKRGITCETTWSDGGAWIDKADGTGVTALDVFAIVRCSNVRAIVGTRRP